MPESCWITISNPNEKLVFIRFDRFLCLRMDSGNSNWLFVTDKEHREVMNN